MCVREKELPDSCPTHDGGKGARTTPYGLVLAISTLTCVVRGYGFNIGDQHNFLPRLKQVLQPELYQNDAMLLRPIGDLSLFEDMLALPSRFVGIESSCFVAYLLVTFVIAVAFYKIAWELFGSRAAAITAVAMLAGAYIHSSTGRSQLFDYYLYPRTVSSAFGLLALVQMLRARWARAALLVGLEFAFHPPSSIATLAVLVVCMAVAAAKGRLSLRLAPAAAGMFLLPASALLLKMLLLRGGRGLEFLAPVDDEWYRIIYTRKGYMFYANWPLHQFAQLALYVAMFLVARRATQPACRGVMLAVLGCAVGINACNFVCRDILRLPVFMQLHLEISTKLIVFLGLVHIGPYVWSKLPMADGLTRATGLALLAQVLTMRGWAFWRHGEASMATATWAYVSTALLLAGLELGIGKVARRPAAKAFQVAALAVYSVVAWDVALVLAIVAAAIAIARHGRAWSHERVAAASAVVFLTLVALAQFTWSALRCGSVAEGVASHFSEPYAQHKDAVHDLAQWMREHTRRSALFLGPADLPELRYLSERSYFVTWKDGGPVIYDRDYATLWRRRMGFVDAVESGSEGHLAAASDFGIDYIIVRAGRTLPLPLAFVNERFAVYNTASFDTHDPSRPETG